MTTTNNKSEWPSSSYEEMTQRRQKDHISLDLKKKENAEIEEDRRVWRNKECERVWGSWSLDATFETLKFWKQCLLLILIYF